MRVLLCGESWVTHSLHIKGVDSFTTSAYAEGAVSFAPRSPAPGSMSSTCRATSFPGSSRAQRTGWPATTR
jgi:Putative glutamine amidotransferase